MKLTFKLQERRRGRDVYYEMIEAIKCISEHCQSCDTCNDCRLYDIRSKKCKYSVIIPKHWSAILLDDILQSMAEDLNIEKTKD